MSINIVCWSQLSVLSTYACCPAVAKTLKARSLYSIWRFNTIFQFLWQLSWFRVRTSHLLKKAHFNSETDVNVFYSDDYPFKKKLYNRISTFPPIHRMCPLAVLTWDLENLSFSPWYWHFTFTETDINVLYAGDYPLKKKLYDHISTSPPIHRMWPLAVLTWGLDFFSFYLDIWLWAFTTLIHNSRAPVTIWIRPDVLR